MLSQAVKSSHALVLPEAEAEHRDGEFYKHKLIRKTDNEATAFCKLQVQSPPPPILAQEPPGSSPHPCVPQGSLA